MTPFSVWLGVIPIGAVPPTSDKQTDAIDPKATLTFFYITREGTPGLLFVGIEVKDDSLKPGGVKQGDDELSPIAFYKGRRFAYSEFEEVK
jgi:hypothetical protein